MDTHQIMSSDDDSVHEIFKAPHHQRRNAISIPARKSSLGHTYPSFDGKTTIMPPPPPPSLSSSSDAQMTKMKQLMCKAIHQLRTLAGQVTEAEDNAAHWQKKWAELDAQHTQLLASHHDTLVAFKTTRRLLLSTRREKLELRRRC